VNLTLVSKTFLALKGLQRRECLAPISSPKGAEAVSLRCFALRMARKLLRIIYLEIPKMGVKTN
jgi:hypothetical protein